MNILGGKRILVVEDELLVADFIEEVLSELGAVVIGPVGRLDQGLALARSEPLDAAVLDINVMGRHSDPIAEILRERGIPFVVSTGYSDAGRHMQAPVVKKPYAMEDLASVMTRILSPSCKR